MQVPLLLAVLMLRVAALDNRVVVEQSTREVRDGMVRGCRAAPLLMLLGGVPGRRRSSSNGSGSGSRQEAAVHSPPYE
jgi:hypothetical protein